MGVFIDSEKRQKLSRTAEVRTLRREPDYNLYETLKSQWIKDNPGASCQSYQSAVRRIAEQCGV